MRDVVSERRAAERGSDVSSVAANESMACRSVRMEERKLGKLSSFMVCANCSNDSDCPSLNSCCM